jgi:hypothetical protein
VEELLKEINESAATQPAEHADSKLRQLQKERLAVLKQIAADKKTLFEQARTSPDVMLQPELAALKAELDICETDDAKTPVLERIAANCKKQEDYFEKLYKGGRVVATDWLVAKAARLEAEIELERAKTKGPAKP